MICQVVTSVSTEEKHTAQKLRAVFYLDLTEDCGLGDSLCDSPEGPAAKRGGRSQEVEGFLLGKMCSTVRDAC